MAANEIDEVSVRLTANAVGLLKQTEDAVEQVEKEMEDLGAAVDKEITDAMRVAGQAVYDFAEEFGTTIEEAAETVATVGKFSEVFGFDQQQLAAVAEGIKNKINKPISEAAEDLGYFSLAAGDAAVSAGAIAAPLGDTFEVLDALGIGGAQAIAGGIQEPLGRAEDTVGSFGTEAEQVFGSKVPSSIETTAQRLDALGIKFNELSPKVQEVLTGIITGGGEAGAGGQAFEDSLIRLTRTLRNWVQTTSRSAEEVAKEFEGSLRAMGLSAQKLQMLIEGQAETIRADMVRAINDSVESAQDSNKTFDESVDRLENLNRLYGLSAEAVKAFAKENNILGQQLTESKAALAVMYAQLEQLPPIFKDQYNPLLEEYNVLIEKNGTLTRDQIKSLEELSGQLEMGVDFWKLLEPLIKKVNDRLVELGGVTLDPLQEQKIIKGAKAYVEAAGSVDKATDSIKRYVDASGKAVERQQGLGSSGNILLDIVGQLGGRFGDFAVELAGAAGQAAVLLLALKGLQEIARYLKDAAEDAIEFSRVTSQSAIALALQANATGEVRVSTSEYVGTLSEMAERLGVAREELIGATNQLILMNQQTGLTSDQVLGLAQQGAAMANVFDKNVGSTLQNLMNFIGSGMRSGLDDFNLQLDESAQKARSAALGYGDNLDALTDQERALVRYSLILDQTNQFVGAAEALQGTWAGQIDAATEKTKEQTIILGNVFAPMLVNIRKIWVRVVEGFSSGLALIGTLLGLLNGALYGVTQGVLAVGEAIVTGIKEGALPSLKELGNAFKETYQEEGGKRAIENVKMITGAMDELEAKTDDLIGSTRELGETVGDVTDEMAQGYIDAAEKFDEGMARIQQRYEDALQDIERQFGQRRLDAATDRERDLAKIDYDAAEDRIEAIKEFMVQEIRLREDHQLAVRQLEERYLLDLEDAVRDRDARGVLSLQRRFNLEKKQREEDYLLNNKRLKEDHKIELRAIERQRLLKRQQRLVAFQEEMLDLNEQERRRREEANLRRARAERDLLDSIKRRLDALAEGHKQELELEIQKLSNLQQALLDAYGPNGWYEQLYDRAIQISTRAAMTRAQQAEIDRLNAQAAYYQGSQQTAGSYNVQAIQSLAGSGGTVGYNVQGIQSLRQRGGSIFATGPTPFLAGEGRPERVDVTPLSESTGQPSAGFRGEKDRMEIVLDVNASEMLSIEVADQTMAEIADVIVNINQRSQGGRPVG